MNSRWNRVEERMPEHNAEVLVWCKYWHSRPFIAIYAFGVWRGEHILSTPEHVTHWMALPESPKDQKLEAA